MNHVKKSNIRFILECLLTLIVIFIVIMGFAWSFKRQQYGFKAKDMCIQNGYPYLLKAGGILYCHKLENGNDVIVPVDRLMD